MMRLLIFGPPGAGKGTQAARICKILGIPAISTGDIFRTNVAAGTELGKKVKPLLDSGQFVPDDLTNDLVRDRLAEPDAEHGFLLDGYPRTASQVVELDDILATHGHHLDKVIELTVNHDLVIERMLKRAVELGRSDDTEEVIRSRQEIYRTQTVPVIEMYRKRSMLVSVDGVADIDTVTQRILDALEITGESYPAL